LSAGAIVVPLLILILVVAALARVLWRKPGGSGSSRLLFALARVLWRKPAKGVQGAPAPVSPGERGVRSIEPEPDVEDVHVTTIGPESVRPGEGFLIEVLFHLEGYEVAEAPGQVVRTDAAVVGLRQGARLTVRLVPAAQDDFTIDQPEAELIWKPPHRRVDFLLTASPGLGDGIRHLRLELWSEKVQLSRTYVQVLVDAGAPRPARRHASPVLRRLPRSAFASYSRTDKDRILDRIAALETVGVDVFIDGLDIRQGARWEEAIYKEIRLRECFLLFWSQAASRSRWVEKEWRHALKFRGEDGIVPNALEPPERCPPPPELEHLQFGSAVDRLRREWTSAAAT